MNGVGGLSGWRWLFSFDGIITLPMAIWAYYALPDLPSNTRVRWLTPEEKQLALDRMKRVGKQLDEPFTLAGLKRILGKWHFWVYTAYYTRVLHLQREHRDVHEPLAEKPQSLYGTTINNFPTVTNAVTIVTTLAYGWVSDGLQIRAPIVYFSLTVCFFAAMNLAIWDGVPFGLEWASFYMTGYAFNAWIALVTYNTTYAPRFLVGNSITAGLIVCAGMTLTAAVLLQRRDDRNKMNESSIENVMLDGRTFPPSRTAPARTRLHPRPIYSAGVLATTGSPGLAVRLADCSALITWTVTPPASLTTATEYYTTTTSYTTTETVVVTTTSPSPLAKRTFTHGAGVTATGLDGTATVRSTGIPVYASAYCDSYEAYYSACSDGGVTAATITAPAVTSTSTESLVMTCYGSYIFTKYLGIPFPTMLMPGTTTTV
ncbi:MFS general substrate transporter [Apiospora phragmitis]|uniref:MFS general substrate transporter n=1 Tax=Apiospora phragmitis TaxID=2905665 RepID=A0ABR1VQ00_9PEZI